nr:probable methyltransferase PMT3 [Ipomoea batatas]
MMCIENQIQFALERGFPAISWCSWKQRGHSLIPRFLDPGGYFAYSSPEAYAQEKKILEIGNNECTCRTHGAGDSAEKEPKQSFWVKPLDNDCSWQREPAYSGHALCRSDDDPDAVWVFQNGGEDIEKNDSEIDSEYVGDEYADVIDDFEFDTHVDPNVEYVGMKPRKKVRDPVHVKVELPPTQDRVHPTTSEEDNNLLIEAGRLVGPDTLPGGSPTTTLASLPFLFTVSSQSRKANLIIKIA